MTAAPHERSFGFEGILGEPITVIENVSRNVQAFLPYNPTMIEIGAHEGAGTLALAREFPHGRIFAFEPNPRAFAQLRRTVEDQRHVTAVNLAFGTLTAPAPLYLGPPGEDRGASLLPPAPAPGSNPDEAASAPLVACTTVDEWCAEHDVASVEFIRLDAGGYELQILQRSREVLRRTLVIVSRTYSHRPRPGIVSHPVLRLFLEMAGFELLSHWYEDGLEGEAMYLARPLYDSLFR